MTPPALTQQTPALPATAPAWVNNIVGYDPAARVADLLANPSNWRDHPIRQRRYMRAILGAIGWVLPVVVNVRTGRVVDGHMRITEAIDAGVDTVPVLYIDVDEPTEREILRTLDPVGDLAIPNRDAVAALLPDPGQSDEYLQQVFARVARSVGVTALTPASIAANRPEAPYSRARELASTWAVERGQIWDIPSRSAPSGVHRLTVGDSTDPAVVAQMLGGARARLVYTDPTYGADYDGGQLSPRERLSNDDAPDLYAPLIAALTPHVDPDTPLYCWFGAVWSDPVFAALTAARWDIHAVVIWVKQQAQYGALRAHYKEQKEPLVYAGRRGSSPAWYGPTNETTVWYADRARVNEYHPTQKPPELAARAMANSSRPGDRVVDPCIGGGATLVAGELMGRLVSGGDLDPAYIAVTLQRVVDDLGLEPRRVYPA